METTLHEIIHALVFSPGSGEGEKGLFVHFRNPNGDYHNGFQGTEENTSFSNIFDGPYNIRGIMTKLLVTPFVKQWVADQFGCPDVVTFHRNRIAGM